MLRRLPAQIEQGLPKGWTDLLRQLTLFGGAYLAYRLVEGAVDGSSAPAFAHARELISIERTLHIFVEPSVQSWASGSHLLMVLATYLYINAQTTILIALLLYLYLFHNRSYYFVRNMVFVAMALGLIGYAFYPTAPPRLVPNWGFVDTVSQVTNTSSQNNPIMKIFINPYAAVPSMHVAFATMIGGTLVRLVKSWPARVWWTLWPVLITFVTVITANHFLLDAVFGLLTAGIAAVVACRLARIRPHVWALEPPAPALAPQPSAQVAVL
ncbi:MAG TPA: phosphatase PAP2 family protein [Solirubrobacteraceae bacterium]|jgi:membrane-associated phospholipid phosphatase|nr:phosphatase PAP2 family protein [Solirubrobacteraceae bacterium]